MKRYSPTGYFSIRHNPSSNAAASCIWWSIIGMQPQMIGIFKIVLLILKHISKYTFEYLLLYV